MPQAAGTNVIQAPPPQQGGGGQGDGGGLGFKDAMGMAGQFLPGPYGLAAGLLAGQDPAQAIAGYMAQQQNGPGVPENPFAPGAASGLASGDMMGQMAGGMGGPTPPPPTVAGPGGIAGMMGPPPGLGGPGPGGTPPFVPGPPSPFGP